MFVEVPNKLAASLPGGRKDIGCVLTVLGNGARVFCEISSTCCPKSASSAKGRDNNRAVMEAYIETTIGSIDLTHCWGASHDVSIK